MSAKMGSLPAGASSTIALSSVTSASTCSNSRRASPSVLPLTASVISDAEALEIAQPEPRKLISEIVSPLRLT